MRLSVIFKSFEQTVKLLNALYHMINDKELCNIQKYFRVCWRLQKNFKHH